MDKSEVRNDDSSEVRKAKVGNDGNEIDLSGYGLLEFEVAQEEAEKEKTICHIKEAKARIIFGIIIVLLIALSWVGATQFAMRTYTPTFNSPYFTTWYTTVFMIVVFPLFSLPQFLEKQPWRFKTFYRESAKIFGPHGVCLISLVKLTLPFCFLWIASNYLYIRALNALNPADVTALFSSVSAFVYVFSIALLKEKFFITRLTAVLISISGIVLFASTYGFKGPTAVGIVLTVIAACFSALYQVLFKLVVKSASGSQVALFLTLLGLCSTLLFWIAIPILHFTKLENSDWSSMPWLSLNVSGVLVLFFNYMMNFGIAFTSPLFIALGTMVGTPLNAAADYVFNGKSFGLMKIIATCMILLGFSLMLISNDALKSFEQKLICAKADAAPPGAIDAEAEIVEDEEVSKS